LVLLSLAFAAALAAPAEEINPTIVGGSNAAPGQFPFIVSLQWTILGVAAHICGGSIIGPNWALSAAHCVTEIPQFGRIDLLVGAHNMAVAGEATRARHEVAQTILHPDWTPGPQVGPDDLVLMRPSTPFVFNVRVRAVRLPAPGNIPTTALTLSGWGATNPAGTAAATILQHAVKPTITITQCRNAFFALGLNGNLVDDTNFCTGPLTGGLSACSGDSGGPLVYGNAPNEIIEGVVSWGVIPCGSVGAPSVYKRVSAYYNWILFHTGIAH